MQSRKRLLEMRVSCTQIPLHTSCQFVELGVFVILSCDAFFSIPVPKQTTEAEQNGLREEIYWETSRVCFFQACSAFLWQSASSSLYEYDLARFPDAKAFSAVVKQKRFSKLIHIPIKVKGVEHSREGCLFEMLPATRKIADAVTRLTAVVSLAVQIAVVDVQQAWTRRTRTACVHSRTQKLIG